MPKLFECFWGDGYRGDSNRSILEIRMIDFFTEDRGYDSIDIKGIDGLNIDEQCNFLDNGTHWVRRVS